MVELPPPETSGETKMDLPENVQSLLLKSGSENFLSAQQESQTNASNVHNLARLSAVRRFSELGPIESRAVSGVLATPIASPTTQEAQK